jgi:hypothetical protein
MSLCAAHQTKKTGTNGKANRAEQANQQRHHSNEFTHEPNQVKATDRRPWGSIHPGMDGGGNA